MTNSEIDLASLVSRLEQLEERQTIVARYATGVKRQLDDLTQQFNARPELERLEEIKKAIAQLSEEFTNLQQLSNPSGTTTSNLDKTETTDGQNQLKISDPAETIKQFFERVEQQEREELLNLNPTPKTNEVEIVLDDAINELVVIDESIEPPNRSFRNEEFKLERLIWLLNKLYAIEAINQKILIDAEEFWKRHNQEELNFCGANLIGIDLSGTSLSAKINLSEANLCQANFSKANLTKVDFSTAILKGSNLSNACLFGTNFEKTNFEEVNIKQAIFNTETIFPIGFDPIKVGAYLIAPGSNLQKANLANTDLSGLNLTKANLVEADLRASNLSNLDLSQAFLQRAKLIKINLTQAKLLQANLDQSDLSQGVLYGANLTAASLQGANLTQVDLSNANLTAANLSNANLISANLSGTTLTGAILIGVNFVGLYLSDQKMSGADLSGVSLCGANLWRANLSGANLTSADLRGANLELANLEKANLKGANIAGANITAQTKIKGAIMPDGTIHE